MATVPSVSRVSFLFCVLLSLTYSTPTVVRHGGSAAVSTVEDGIHCASNKTCKIADNRTICWPVSCPMPPCDNPVLTPGDCCNHCPPCPQPCQINGHHFCHPIPCPAPGCVDSVTTPGDCCEHCPHGQNCGKDGKIIPVHHSMEIGGKNCTCLAPYNVHCV